MEIMNISKKCIINLSTFLLGLFLLVTTILIWKKANTIHIHSTEEQKRINAENNTDLDSVEFIYTEQEQLDIQKWKNKSMDALLKDALEGDRAALYMLGESFYFGFNLPINIQIANSYLAQSASLGFPPALDHIANMYINNKTHGLLGLVYKNLTISFGHTEFIRNYHNLKNEAIEKSGEYGQRLFNEIERITWQKYSNIIKNQLYAQEMKTNNKPCRIGTLDKNITYEDYEYDNDYWVDVYNGDNEVFNLKEIKEQDMIFFDKLYYLYQEALEANEKDLEDIAIKIKETLNMMSKDKYSTSEIELLGRRAKAQAKKVYKYVQKIENDAKEARKLSATE